MNEGSFAVCGQNRFLIERMQASKEIPPSSCPKNINAFDSTTSLRTISYTGMHRAPGERQSFIIPFHLQQTVPLTTKCSDRRSLNRFFNTTVRLGRTFGMFLVNSVRTARTKPKPPAPFLSNTLYPCMVYLGCSIWKVRLEISNGMKCSLT